MRKNMDSTAYFTGIICVFIFSLGGSYSTDIFKMSGEMYLCYILKHFIYLNYAMCCILIKCKNAVT